MRFLISHTVFISRMRFLFHMKQRSDCVHKRISPTGFEKNIPRGDLDNTSNSHADFIKRMCFYFSHVDFTIRMHFLWSACGFDIVHAGFGRNMNPIKFHDVQYYFF